MRLLALAILLAAVPASSQSVAETAVRPAGRLTGGQRALMVVAGVVSLFLVVPDDDFGVATFAAPVAAGLAVYGTGRALGHRGRLGPTLAGAALGSLPAHVLYYVGSRAPNDGFWWYLAAEAVHLVGPPVGAAVGFGRSLPAPTLVVLVGPDGEQTAGLALRVAF